jgi:hypothetical protein
MSNVYSAGSTRIVDTFTGGGLLIPRVAEPLSLRLYLSNLSPETESVAFQFNRLTDTAKFPLISGSVAIPGSGAATISLNPAQLGLPGSTVEAVVELPLIEPPGTFSIHPSLNLLQGGLNTVLLPLAILTTGDFARVKEEQLFSVSAHPRRCGFRDIPSNLFALTWGLIDIPAPEPGMRTEVSLWLSSLSNQAEDAVVTVNSLIPGTTQKRHVLTQPVTVPAGQAEEVRIEGVEGLAIEAIMEIPFAAPPLTVLPLLTPSMTVKRINSNTGAVQTVSFISPGQALFADR